MWLGKACAHSHSCVVPCVCTGAHCVPVLGRVVRVELVRTRRCLRRPRCTSAPPVPWLVHDRRSCRGGVGDTRTGQQRCPVLLRHRSSLLTCPILHAGLPSTHTLCSSSASSASSGASSASAHGHHCPFRWRCATPITWGGPEQPVGAPTAAAAQAAPTAQSAPWPRACT